jgi:RNA polymerase sigma-32 factor
VQFHCGCTASKKAVLQLPSIEPFQNLFIIWSALALAESKYGSGEPGAREVIVSSFSDPHIRSLIVSAQRAPKLSAEEERACIAGWQERRDRALAGRLMAANLRHVLFTARKFGNYGIPIADLVSEGNIGLMHALNRFDAKRGVRFSTYAVYWIRAQIVMAVMDSWSLLSGPRGALNSRVFFRLRRERDRLSLQLGSQAVAERLAAEFGVTERRMQEMLGQLDHRGVSLDAPDARTGQTLLDQMSGDEDQEAALERREERLRVERAVARARPSLDAREAFILDRRLLADSAEKLSLGQIGAHFGVSRERVRQIELRACGKLRNEVLRDSADGDARAA